MNPTDITPKDTAQRSRTPRANAGIRIEAARVTGFRALQHICVSLELDTTVLVGENNTGKSAFLEAMDTAIGSRRAVPDDLYVDAQGNRSNEFNVDLLLAPRDSDTFSERLAPLFGDAIRRSGTREFIGIRTTGSVGRDHSTVERRRYFIEGWYGCDMTNRAEAAEIQGQKLTERHLALISFTLLHANRDLVPEMQRKSSRWGRLLAQRDLPQDALRDIEGWLRETGQYMVRHSPLLARLRKRLNEIQSAIPTVGNVELNPLPGRIDDLTKATDIQMTNPGGPTLPLRFQGLGSRSLAEIMVYQAFVAELSEISETLAPHGFACFEEPEAHLHPQAQIAVMALINQMPGQCVVTTHSPQIVSEMDPRQIRLFRSEHARVTVTQPTSLTRQETIRLRRLAERPYGQVFFARLVIIGDGATERAALPVFARHHWGIVAEGRGVTFIDPQSLGQAAPLVQLLEDLGIPWLLFADGDTGGHRALDAIGERIDRCLTPGSHQVVALPEGMGFEEYLINEGFRSAIKQVIADRGGGQSQQGSYPKNRSHSEDQQLMRQLKRIKGTYGAAAAEAIVADMQQTGRPMPERIAKLLKRADRILGLDSS